MCACYYAHDLGHGQARAETRKGKREARMFWFDNWKTLNPRRSLFRQRIVAATGLRVSEEYFNFAYRVGAPFPRELFHIHGAGCAALLIPSSGRYRVARRRAVVGAHDASEICATNHKPPSLAGNWIEGAEAARCAWTAWSIDKSRLAGKRYSSGVDRYALVFCAPV